MDLLEKLKTITNEENIFINEPMSKHTTFKTGGTADFFVVAKSTNEIIELLKLDYPKTIIGNGSNLLVKDGGIRGLVIKIANSNYEINDEFLIADSGCILGKLSMIAYENSLAGLEFACGIPGSLGGAIFMNAGAYGGEMSNIVTEVTVCDYAGNIKKIKDFEFGYRKSVFQKGEYIILSSKLKLNHGDKKHIKEQMDSNIESRRSKQPIDKPSAGSTFKRPEGYIAAKLIDEAGLKGYRIGGAEVSTLHAGFIINSGKATSSDILNLMRYVQEKVYEKFGVKLEPEVQIIGEDNS